MSGAVQDFEYRLTLRDEARPALAITERAALTLGTGVDKVKGAFASLGESAKNFQQKFGPAAGAISGIGGALGAAGGEMGKFVAGAAQGAAAFAAGGPLGLAIVGSTIAIDEWAKTTKESDAALAVWRDQLKVTTPLHKEYADSIAAMKDETKGLKDAVFALGKGEHEVRIARATALKTELETNLANIAASERLRQADVNAAEQAFNLAKQFGRGVDEAREAYDLQLGLQKRVHDNADVLRKQVSNIETEVWSMADAWMAVDKAARDAAGAKAWSAETAALLSGSAAALEAGFGTEEDAGEAYQRRAALREAAAETERQREWEHAQKIVEINRAKAEAIADNEEAFAQQTYAAQKAMRQQTATDAMAAVGILAGASQQLVSDLVAGQDFAAQRFGLAIMAAAGQSLVASGTKLGGEAIVSSLTPGLQGLAAAQGAAAAGLIGSGVALGGVASGLGSLLGGSGGAANSDAPRAAVSATSPSTGARGASGDGGGTSVTIVYAGVSGPTADQGARAATRALTRGQRRGVRR